MDILRTRVTPISLGSPAIASIVQYHYVAVSKQIKTSKPSRLRKLGPGTVKLLSTDLDLLQDSSRSLQFICYILSPQLPISDLLVKYL